MEPKRLTIKSRRVVIFMSEESGREIFSLWKSFRFKCLMLQIKYGSWTSHCRIFLQETLESKRNHLRYSKSGKTLNYFISDQLFIYLRLKELSLFTEKLTNPCHSSIRHFVFFQIKSNVKFFYMKSFFRIISFLKSCDGYSFLFL